MKTELTADKLYHRHKLSYPQIDRLLGTNHVDLYQKDIIGNFKIIREFIVVTDEFRKMNIRFIPLKGPLLSHRIYKDATVRRFHDLDILISAKDIRSAYDYLVGVGYCADIKLSDDGRDQHILEEYEMHLSFIHPKTTVCIELHIKIFNYKQCFGLDFNSIYEYNTTIQLYMNREFRVLNAEYDLFYLLVHGSTHKWQRLKWLVDISDYIRNIDFDRLEFNRLTQKHGALRILSLYNSMAAIYLPDPSLFVTKVKIPNLLTRICIKYVEAEKGEFAPKKFFEIISNLFYGNVFLFLLFPDFNNIKAIVKSRLVCLPDSKDLKTTNTLILILYRPFGYFIRHIREGRNQLGAMPPIK